MTRIIALCLVAALGWAGWWGISAWRLNNVTEDWLEHRRSDGWIAQYDNMTLRGFPSRLDRTFDGLVLGTPDGPVWSFEKLGLYQMTYKPNHIILAVAGEITTRQDTHTWTTDTDGLRASLVRDGGQLARANLEADTLSIIGPDTALTLTDIRAALMQVSPDRSRLSASTAQIVSGEDARAGRDLALDITIAWDSALMGQVSDSLRRPDEIDIRLASYTLNNLKLEATGNVTLDPQGRPTGRLDIRAVNWRGAVASAVEAGQIPSELERPLTQGLALWAKLQGNPQTLDIPVDFTNGQASIGPVRMGNILRFW